MNQTVVSPLGMTQKSVVSPFSSFGKEEWSKTEVVGEIMFVPFLLKMIDLCIHLPPPPTGTPPSRRRRIEDRTDYHLAQNRAEMSYTVWT